MESAVSLSAVLPTFLSVLMFGVGLTLRMADFKLILLYPKVVVVGTSGQLFVLPAIAFLLVFLIQASPEVAVGVILVAACPGGPVSNLFSYLSGGDAAISVVLTAVSTIAAVVTIPLYTGLALSMFGTGSELPEMPLLATSFILFVTVLVPVFIGMLINKLFARFSVILVKYINKASTYMVLILSALVLVKERHHLAESFSGEGLIVVLLVLCAAATGYVMSRLANLSIRHVKTIVIEVGFQNAVLAFTLALTVLESTEVALPAALYTTVSVPVLAVLVLVFKRWPNQ
jgi:BASS family bile acid:Na+ symporter